MQPDVPMRHSLYTPIAYPKSTNEELQKRVLAQVPLLKERLDYLKEKIAFYESPAAIPNDALLNTEKFMHTVGAIKILLPMLKEEYDALQKKINVVGSQIESDK